MKKTFLFIAFLAISLIQSVAQYKIDLSNTDTPVLKPLKLGHAGPRGKEIELNNLYMTIGGKPVLPVMGEFHYSRMDHRYWRDALLKMKASGINIVATYMLWSLHEEFEGKPNFEGNLDVRKFIKLCDELDLLVHLRIGPYCNAEIHNGALPDWIMQDKRFQTRSNDPLYLEYTRRWYEAIYGQVGDLLYKKGGPVMAIQLENEYVRKGMVVSHLMNLKRMAVETGFDVPIYSKTHWMDGEAVDGEIVPYAGYYIETPWTSTGKKELPVSNFEYFSYNRIADNIGTDIIKIEGKVESLSGKESEAPYFTCEIGVGTPSFYRRRAVVPQEMAGENINLRLGCGVNLMGYYMYVGGSNPVGEKRTFESSGPRVSYDYQAPVREFGTLGDVMYETKKYNYFMNDFGSALAPAVAYLPVSNQNTDNLQWAVREHNNTGFLFVSNHLYKNDRKAYKNVQFTVQLKGENLKMPRRKTTIKNGAYFLWPFNQELNGVLLKYATAQPICSHKEGNTTTYFFFQDDEINAEYLIDNKGIADISVVNGIHQKEKGQYFIGNLDPGKECKIELTKTDGSKVILFTLTEKESDDIWKLQTAGNDFVTISSSTLLPDNGKVAIVSETPDQSAWIYNKGAFTLKEMRAAKEQLRAVVKPIAPLAESACIKPVSGTSVQRAFDLQTYSTADRVFLRVKSESPLTCQFNDKSVSLQEMGDYQRADISSLLANGKNNIIFTLSQPDKGVTAEIEVLLKNGKRIMWTTDNTWTGTDVKEPVAVFANRQPLSGYAAEEKLAVYEITTPETALDAEEVRAYISFRGDVANAYIGTELINDFYFDGSDWIIGLSRHRERLQHHPLTIRIDGLKSLDNNIYFEKNVIEEECLNPEIREVTIKKDYRFMVQ
ncbi:beta-galactosidase [Parabacteroides sp. OttesenSCG-928-K15]|nr:beta-galactosidase [Parabacteroides sp. OttesenSCG-928-K15]